MAHSILASGANVIPVFCSLLSCCQADPMASSQEFEIFSGSECPVW
ncbi:hypothetical protein A359_06610 [secondary endosymbiont of Ctenarytaina eucalypti]|uniref:Uncharacterized protein n=1 Tax=secondary endosymbiont of Ctenarytaina eucalypti TaxID=1199245 RepID=J3TFL3_9ENTR|nr:hypothetical protein A359_06610 [secondary endosymbiont of Ctenarytaina eucalypti]